MDRQAFIEYIAARGKEASTWRGLILILTSAGLVIKPELAEAIVAVGLLLAGAVGAAFPDGGKRRQEFQDTRPMERP
jgi:hypothetical protein